MNAVASASDVWVYLSRSPLLGLTLTLAVYVGAQALARRLKFHPLANPVLMAVTGVVICLVLTGTPYPVYFEGAQFVHFLLGPATVALAIPLYAQLPRIKALIVPISGALLVGALTAAVSAVLIARGLGASEAVQASLLPKSVTAPIAMSIAEKTGGLPSLTAVLVILTGILGATLAPAVYRLARLDGAGSQAAQGFALGLTSHGIGTARALQLHETTGAFAALAMGMNGAFSALVLPLVAHLLL
ncbi:LrgB family protein [Amphibiibacter pelophylacis]|uniref:LrgB family protein n=1 Tax=Amphibiibacter pelophylacis TaxID=1799477 RepID=A0ACC6P0D5_9BURK